MTLLEQVQQNMVIAMKAHDTLQLNTLRSIKTALDQWRVNQQKPVDEAAELQVLSMLAKQRREAFEAFTLGDRPEMAQKEAAELKLIETFMPVLVSEDELNQLIQTTITETGAAGPKAMGVVMKGVKERLNGKRADGKMLSDKVRAALA